MDILFNKGLTMLVILGAVFMFALMVMSILNRAFARYQEKYVTQSMRDLSDMFLFIDGRQLLILNISITALFVLVGLLFFGTFFTIILAACGFFVPTLMVRIFKAMRLKKFNKQLVDSLSQMSNAFKAGLTFPQAMEHIAQESESPLAQEFMLFVREIKLGKPMDEALTSIADRVGSEDLDLVVTATIISRQLGGNMAEMFDTIAATIRERFRLEGKIKALTSQGKLQGWIVAALPLVLGLVMNYMRPDLMQPMFDGWFGYILVLIILLMELAGIWMIRKIVNINV
ncbi:MAG: type II secretion system F family protein [Deltaproteobacteria bacterium]|nr:type II secretion system F family protein [Deltaproteobacteria bacterium]MBW1870722.1 type II secretion system F family protein [Deltaproteobacteria bacterium]